MKTYMSRKNARVAAERAGENMPDVSVHEVTAKNIRKFGLSEKEIGRFVYTVKPVAPRAPVSKYDRDEVPEVEIPAPVEVPPVNTLKANLAQSTVASPVRLVHDIANSMPGARRKDVIAACVEQGVALNTARTQYQVWFRNQRKVG